jgi:hypothetical protein
MTYNKEEIQKWMKEAGVVDIEQEFCHSGNIYETRIYTKDGKYYILSFCNGTVSRKWIEGKGYAQGEYEPIEVFRSEREEEIHYFQKVIEYKDADKNVAFEKSIPIRQGK